MPTRRTPLLAAATLGAALVLSGCGGWGSSTMSGGASSSTPMSMSPASEMSRSTPSAGSGSHGPASTIEIHDFAFGGVVTVAAGSTVTVTNDDSETHSVTADSGGAFDVTVPAGSSRTFMAPHDPGSYAYHCVFHSDMHGMLRVR